MILVTGASGNVGSALVAELRAEGVPFRAAYRDPSRTARSIESGTPAVTLDFDVPETLAPALDGVEAVFLVTATGPAQTTQELAVVDAARAAGVRVVKLSVWRADEELTPIAKLHRPVERALEDSELPWTFLRPNFYLQNFLRQPLIRTAGTFVVNRVDAPISFLDATDIARVAAKVLTTDGHDGQTYALTGPAALTYSDAAAVFSDVLGKPVRYQGLDDDAARPAMLGVGMPEFQVDTLIEVARAYRNGGADTVTSTVADVTGCAPQSLVDFVRRNQATFN